MADKSRDSFNYCLWNASYIRLPCGVQSICQPAALEPAFLLFWVTLPGHFLGIGHRCQVDRVFLGQIKKFGRPEAFHHPQLLVWFPSLASRWDAVAATCQNCVVLNGVNELELKFCLKVSSPWEILKKGMSGCLIFTTETDSFFSICRSSKGDIRSEGYILEVERCSSLNQLSDKKEIPDFIKKVSKKKSGGRGEEGGQPPKQNIFLFAL